MSDPTNQLASRLDDAKALVDKFAPIAATLAGHPVYGPLVAALVDAAVALGEQAIKDMPPSVAAAPAPAQPTS